MPPAPAQHDACPRCGAPLGAGVALVSTTVASDDFGSDAGEPGTTQSVGGPGRAVRVRKCPSCGYSRTPEATAEALPDA